MPERFDSLTFEQIDAIHSALDFSIGKRLGALIEYLGMDKSVRIGPKSAKQLKRYVGGDEPPVSVLKNLCRAAGASLDWLIEAERRSKIDCRLERHLLEAERKLRAEQLDKTANETERLEIEFALVSIERLLEIVNEDEKSGRMPEQSLDNMPPAPSVQRQLDALTHANENNSSELTSREGIAAVRFEDLRASAGDGLVAIDNPEGETVGISVRIMRQFGLSPEKTLLMLADGESMSPTITTGAVIFVDRRDRQLREGRVYVLSLAGDLVVKRVRLDLDGGLTLLSDNTGPAYQPRRIDPVDVERLTVVGRVACAMSPI